MSDREIYASIVAGIIEYFDGVETVARILNVTVAELQAWSTGKAMPPEHLLLRLISLAQEDQRRVEAVEL